MTTFTAKYLAPLNPGNKYLFDRNEAARRNPVRRIPASQYTPMPSLKGCRAPILVEKADDAVYPSIARPFERVETRA